MSQPTPSLAEFQRWLSWLLTHPRGVETALLPGSSKDLDERFIEPGRRWLCQVNTSVGVSRERRLAVYAEAYFARALEALRTDYPALHTILGEERFREVTGGLLLAQPPSSFTLADFGEGLPQLLPELLRGNEPRWLSELALLERSVVEVTLSDLPRPFIDGQLPSDPEVWAGAQVLISSALRLVKLTHCVDSVWPLAMAGSAAVAAPAEEERLLVVVRDPSGVVFHPLSREGWEVLADLRGGRCLGTICNRIAETGGQSEHVTLWFRSWMEQGWFSGVVFRNASGPR